MSAFLISLTLAGDLKAGIIQLTSASQLSLNVTKFTPADPAGTVYPGPSVSFNAKTDRLTFARGSGAYEIDQVGYNYGDSAFADGTKLVNAGGFQGPGDGGGVTIAFLIPVQEFALNLDEFAGGTSQLQFTVINGTFSPSLGVTIPNVVGTFYSNVDPVTGTFAAAKVTGSDLITSVIFNDPGTSNNLAFGNIAFVPTGVALQAQAPEPSTLVLGGIALFGIAGFARRRRSSHS